ncbi:hypothetical protein ABID08_001369 [Rhizobium binae]|uniref:DUF1236 domain-containing protein n=1 Tax=Rhizobium binae TaxID=1138190 RepID=A0ABV2MC36_9HYPH|nr:DUF1236 domain-containing protein [Rhizobium binae]NKL47886.1 DUF1236 domain-containing protein [Rhizobium leguminosarum bv. viciae]MBX4953061.1 DUF1236 domain-containing protein [Rhizobium binae]MBX4967593.1 DUF1236 domain-containing protein [Rhizobium binae]MBX4990322.1 DUF1236 domain-containing protein [Rhizobium binae]QSY82599.1 DUF1236 domain-containing protein [Rhizobium binae]
MKSNHFAMLVAALSLSVSPLATLPAVAQQDTKSGNQAQSGSQSTDSGSQAGSGKTGTDCTPDASGACPQGKAQSSQQKSGSSDTQKSAEQPSTDSSTSGTASGKASTETKPGSQDAGGGTTTEQKPAAKSGSTDTSGGATSGAKSTTTQGGDATKQSTDQNATTNKSSSETNVNISVEQQTEIRSVVKEVHVAPVKEVDFTVSLGVKIPKKVRLEPLPPRIVKIVPQYEGYRFFILADGRIVIVDPNALTIVYIIEA